MTIAAPTIVYLSNTTTSVTIRHTPPSVVTAPSTSWAKTVVFVRKMGSGDPVQTQEVTAAGTTTIVLSPLDVDATYEITATALSDQDEVSPLTSKIRVVLSSVPGTGILEDFVNIIGTSVSTQPALTTTDAVAKYLEAVGFDLNDGTTLMAGMNLFVDSYPKWWYDQNDNARQNRDYTVVLLQTEPGRLYRKYTKRDRAEAGIRVVVFDGNRDRAKLEASRLYHFFRREDNAQFESDAVSVHDCAPLEEPGLNLMEASGLESYSFRLSLKVVFRCSDNPPL
jgi:hypothetical protein